MTASPNLTDFGLVLDKSFALTDIENAFFRRHAQYDDAEFLLCFGTEVYGLYRRLPETRRKRFAQRYGFGDDAPYLDVVTQLLDRIGETAMTVDLRLPDNYVSTVVKYRDVIRTLGHFFTELRDNPRKDTPFPNRKLQSQFKLADYSPAG